MPSLRRIGLVILSESESLPASVHLASDTAGLINNVEELVRFLELCVSSAVSGARGLSSLCARFGRAVPHFWRKYESSHTAAAGLYFWCQCRTSHCERSDESGTAKMKSASCSRTVKASSSLRCASFCQPSAGVRPFKPQEATGRIWEFETNNGTDHHRRSPAMVKKPTRCFTNGAGRPTSRRRICFSVVSSADVWHPALVQNPIE